MYKSKKKSVYCVSDRSKSTALAETLSLCCDDTEVCSDKVIETVVAKAFACKIAVFSLGAEGVYGLSIESICNSNIQAIHLRYYGRESIIDPEIGTDDIIGFINPAERLVTLRNKDNRVCSLLMDAFRSMHKDSCIKLLKRCDMVFHY